MPVRLPSRLLVGVSFAACVTAAGATAAQADTARDKAPLTAWEASQTHSNDDMIATGVARARDRLDSATSTSSLADSEIAKIAPTSMGDLFRNIPGIRAEASAGEVNNSYTIRGLPLVSTGAKYLQFQEDGLPVLEFGDFLLSGSDMFMRVDFNVAQIESIRGGSASTFASNSPGGVVNLISKTGEVEGGSVQMSAGLNYRNYRTDFDYGGHIDDALRFHIGGYVREGNGPRHAGFTADHGGQVRFNLTREFAGGFVRIEGKLLDDHNASYLGDPVAVSGTNAAPHFQSLPGFSVSNDTLVSRLVSVFPVLDPDGNLSHFDLHDGYHAKARSLGIQAKFDVAGWTVSEHLRYADQSGETNLLIPLAVLPAAFAPAALGAPGGSLAYANGPHAGQTIANPFALNGNGLVTMSLAINAPLRDLTDITNDLRASHVWSPGGSSLTATLGLYNSRQSLSYSRRIVTLLQDDAGGGNSALINVINANGSAKSFDGALNFYGPGPGSYTTSDVTYTIVAPYASLNYHQGRLSVGGSIRLDAGSVGGTIRQNGPFGVKTVDVDGNGIIANAERTFGYAPASADQPVNYRYHYLSYSGSVNYRLDAALSLFARYSRGARAGADRLLFTPAISAQDGSLLSKSAAYDPARQAEVGVKFRDHGLFANLTGFWAKVSETNTQLAPNASGVNVLSLVQRSYRAFGGEFEGGIRHGGFSLTGSATVTNAKILAAEDPTLIGNTPRHQAKLIFQAMPQYETKLFTIGADVIGTLGSFAQDTDKLRMPGFTTVNAFVQVRPVPRVVLSLNVDNVFDTLALTSVADATLPASGVTAAQTLYGRTITTAIRFYF